MTGDEYRAYTSEFVLGTQDWWTKTTVVQGFAHFVQSFACAHMQIA